METPVKCIAVGTDGSEAATRAVCWAAREAHRRGRPLRIVHAFVWPMLNVSVRPQPGLEGSGLRNAAADLLEAATDRAREFAPGIEITTTLPVAGPAAALVAASKEAELVVIGSDEWGPVLGALVGSVGVVLVAEAHCPVVVVRHPVPATRDRIVAGIDCDDADRADAVLRFAFAEAALWMAELSVVHVLGAHERPDPDDRIRDLVGRWADKYRDVAAVTEIVIGAPVDTLAARTGAADLLVLGAHGWGGLAGLLHHSVSRRALAQAGCPVAVVREDH